MKIIYLEPANIGDLSSVYNQQIADIPYCYPISPEEFEIGFRYKKYEDETYSNIHSEAIIIGEVNGEILGFADVVIAEIEEDGKIRNEGVIRFLTYQPGYRHIGQAILDEAEKYLLNLDKYNINQISAFRISYHNDYCYRFYHFGFGLVSDMKWHIAALLLMNGYKIEGGEVFLDWLDYEVSMPQIPDKKVEIKVTQKPGRGILPGLDVQALDNGSEIGVCNSLSAGQYCQAKEAQNCVFIKWLGVEEPEHRKGWGRYLLQRNLWEMRKIGYKNTIISTNIKNYRAQLFYTNYGYKIVDTTYQFIKKL